MKESFTPRRGRGEEGIERERERETHTHSRGSQWLRVGSGPEVGKKVVISCCPAPFRTYGRSGIGIGKLRGGKRKVWGW